jgi:hypothetical protein
MKKIMKNTVGVALTGVAITEANKIPQYGGVLGTTMAAGNVVNATKSKKKGGWF